VGGGDGGGGDEEGGVQAGVGAVEAGEGDIVQVGGDLEEEFGLCFGPGGGLVGWLFWGGWGGWVCGFLYCGDVEGMGLTGRKERQSLDGGAAARSSSLVGGPIFALYLFHSLLSL